MNVYRYTGVIGIAVGVVVLCLLAIPDAQAGTWLVQAVSDQVKTNLTLHVAGGIAAIACGGYLFAFARND